MPSSAFDVFFGGVKCLVFSACIRVLIHSYLPRFPKPIESESRLFIPVLPKGSQRLRASQRDSHVCSSAMINHILRGRGTLRRKLAKCFVMILSSLKPAAAHLDKQDARPSLLLCDRLLLVLTPERDLSLSGPSNEMLSEHREP